MQVWITKIHRLLKNTRVLMIIASLLVCLAGVLVGCTVYVIGRKPPVFLTEWPNREENPLVGGYVASKTGATYYLPWCGNAFRIKQVNRRIFSSEREAVTAGFRPAKGCRGLTGG